MNILVFTCPNKDVVEMLRCKLFRLLRYRFLKRGSFRKNISRFVFAISLLPAPSALLASPLDIGPIDYPEIRFTSLSSSYGVDRLSTAIVQDSHGYMWFATQSGLFKFDGVSVENVSQQADAPNQLTFSLFVDSNGMIWIGTQMGVARYDTVTQSFDRIELPAAIQPRVFDFLERDETIYVGTSDGLYSIEGTKISLVHDLEGGVARSLILDGLSRLWIGTERRGLFVETQGTLRRTSLEVDSVRELLLDSAGMIWVASLDKGLLTLDPNHSPWVLAQVGLEHTVSRVRAILEDNDGDVWVGSDEGLHRWIRPERRFDHYYSGVGPAKSLRDGVIYDLFMDDSDTIWISTYSGISRFNTRQNLVKQVNLDSLDLGGAVGSFAERRDGTVAIGTNKGILLWEPPTGVIKDYFSLEENISSLVTALVWSEDDSLWIGTYSDGLFRLDGSVLEGPFESDQLFERNGIADLHIDERNRLWIATAGAGIHSLDIHGGGIASFPDPTNPEGSFPGMSCLSISEDADGYFWISTNDAGPFRFDPINGNTSDFSEGLKKLASSVFVGISGLWVGASTGEIHLIRDFQGQPQRMLSDFSQKAIAVLGISDIDDFMLIVGQGVLLLFDESTNEVTILDASNGVLADFTGGVKAKLSSGHVVVGGSEGFNIVSPSNFLSDYGYQPRIVLSEVQIDREVSTDFGETSLSLNHSENDLVFRYVITDFLIPEKQRSSFLLEGFDREWIDNGSNRSITYTNLDPGSYVLRVRGTNSEGVWSPNELAVPIHISAPWWETWWAYSLYVVVALMAFYQLLQLSSRRVALEAEGRFNQRLRHYVSALDDASECVLNATESGRILYVNDAIREVLGKTVSDAIGHSLFDVLFSSSEDRTRAQDSLRENGRYLCEIKSPSSNGKKMLEISIRKGEEKGEDQVAFVCVVRDVTARSEESEKLRNYVESLKLELEKVSGELHEYVAQSIRYRNEAEARFERDECLLRSFHDRINDNFQMLSSLFSIQSAKTSDGAVVDMLDENQQRIKTVGLVHEQLLQTKEMNHVAMADYVDVLATNLYRRLAPSNIQLELIKELSPVKLSMDQAVPAGLILNELVTNALVHAFKEKTHGSGKLKVSFYELAGDCVILISDDGLGLSHSFQAESDSGVGFEIVSILTQQLDGSFKRVGGIGTTFEVRFPIVSST